MAKKRVGSCRVPGVRLRGREFHPAGEDAGEVHRGPQRGGYPLPHVRHQDHGEGEGREVETGVRGQGSGASEKDTQGYEYARGSVIRLPGFFWQRGQKGE